MRFLSHRPLRSRPSYSRLVSTCNAPSSRCALDRFSEAHCAGHQAASRLAPVGCAQPPLSAAPPAASTAAVADGVRVRIEGLRAAPEMNGRTGIACGVLDCSGRWRVNVNADGAKRACVGTFKPENLRVLPSLNFSTEWLGEDGCVYPKNVAFSSHCAKGHLLVPLCDLGASRAGPKLMCRLCHAFCERQSDSAASWLVCSVVEDCCGGYAVCSYCAQTPVADEVHPACADDSNTSVRGAVHRPQLLSHLTPCAAGHCTAVRVVAELNPALVTRPHLHFSILPDVREAVHVAETLQL
jgi:hypothetical protein